MEPDDDFSIDSLVATREHELKTRPENFIQRPKPESSAQESSAVPNLDDCPDLASEATIFQPGESSFPESIFSLVVHEEEPSGLTEISPTSPLHVIARVTPTRVAINASLISSLLYGLIMTGDDSFCETIIHLHPHVVAESTPPISHLIFFLRRLLRRDEALAVYALLFFDASLIPDTGSDLFYVHLGALMSNRIVNHRYFFRTEKARQTSIAAVSTTVAESAAGIIAKAPLPSFGPIVQFLPLTCETAPFLRDLFFRALVIVSGIEQENVNELRTVAAAAARVKGMAETGQARASAILALVERVVAASVLIGDVALADVRPIARALRFTITGSISDYTSIREQVQATRTQITLILEEMETRAHRKEIG